ncbi:MBL fold metallo-hydrolase [Candidatus Sumerlaeota bacterium]|nr:MBL fold metallo-hydrolase [Candidatus Sumerlaeota bacterium]
MRIRLLRFCLLVIFAFLANLSIAQRAGKQQAASPVEFRKISDRLYEIRGGRGANGGACIGDNEVLLVDSKMDEASVKQALAELGKLTDKPVKYVVNTHADGDHVAGNRYLPAGTIFVAHENCRKEFFHAGRDGSPSQWSDPKLSAFLPSITYRTKMDMQLGDKRVELWYFGVGHTTGDTVVYFPEEKTAFVGDQMFLGRTPLIHAYKGGNSFENVKTLTKMLETLDAEHFCSGHSDMTNRQGVKDNIASMQRRQEKVGALIKKGKSLEEAKTEFGPDEAGLVETIYKEIKAGQSVTAVR